MLKISKIYNSNGVKKGKTEKKKSKGKETEGKLLKKISELKKESGKTESDNWKERRKELKDKQINSNIYVNSLKKTSID